MALINCDECGYKVSTKAEICPHCGNPVLNNASVSGGSEPLLVMCRKCTNVQNELIGDTCERCGTNVKTGLSPSRTGCFLCICLAVILVLSIVFFMTTDSGQLFKNKKIVGAVHTGRGMFLEWKKDVDFVWKETRPMRKTIKANLIRRKFSDGSIMDLELTKKEQGIFKDPETRKSYKINELGDLDIYDDKGYMRTVKKNR